jgi:hypothetical protein
MLVCLVTYVPSTVTVQNMVWFGFWWCFYITVDIATVASLNGVCKNQQMCHTLILFYYSSMITDEHDKNSNVLSFSEKDWFVEGKAYKDQIRFVIPVLQKPPLCSS